MVIVFFIFRGSYYDKRKNSVKNTKVRLPLSGRFAIACSEAAGALQNKSDDLTLCINSYVDTGNSADMTEYLKL